jgi:hypothetical protein
MENNQSTLRNDDTVMTLMCNNESLLHMPWL